MGITVDGKCDREIRRRNEIAKDVLQNVKKIIGNQKTFAGNKKWDCSAAM